jgi:hypothetical protein
MDFRLEIELTFKLAKRGARVFEVQRILRFNRVSVPGWWFNGKVLERRHFGRLQLKLLDWMIWLIRRIDRLFPWQGLSLIAVARRTGE